MTSVVSILVPIFKVEKFIESCVRSLLEQTYPYIEFIFVDDCSPDNSIAVLQQTLLDYPERANAIKILRHDRNRGLAEARNTALNAARGDYFCCVDSDDCLERHAIERLISATGGGEADLVIFQNTATSSELKVQKTNPKKIDSENYLRKLLCHEEIVTTCCKFWKRNVWTENQIGWIPNINHGEDNATTPRAANFCKIIMKIPDKLYFYNQDNGNSLRHECSETEIEQRIQADQVICDFFLRNRADLMLFVETGMLRTKLFLLEAIISKSVGYPEKSFTEVAVLYPQLSILCHPLPFLFKVLLLFLKLPCRNMQFYLLRFVIRKRHIYNWVIRLIHRRKNE